VEAINQAALQGRERPVRDERAERYNGLRVRTPPRLTEAAATATAAYQGTDWANRHRDFQTSETLIAQLDEAGVSVTDVAQHYVRSDILRVLKEVLVGPPEQQQALRHFLSEHFDRCGVPVSDLVMGQLEALADQYPELVVERPWLWVLNLRTAQIQFLQALVGDGSCLSAGSCGSRRGV
jgi:hypothetical protein